MKARKQGRSETPYIVPTNSEASGRGLRLPAARQGICLSLQAWRKEQPQARRNAHKVGACGTASYGTQ